MDDFNFDTSDLDSAFNDFFNSTDTSTPPPSSTPSSGTQVAGTSTSTPPASPVPPPTQTPVAPITSTTTTSTQPTTLYEYYTNQGQALPSIEERAPLYAQMGGTGTYTGTAEQNNFLLSQLLNQGGQTGTTQSGQTNTSTTTGTPPAGMSQADYDAFKKANPGLEPTDQDVLQQQLAQAEAEYQAKAKEVTDTITNIQNGTIPLSTGEQAQVDALKAQFQNLVDQQTKSNTSNQNIAKLNAYRNGGGEDANFTTSIVSSIVTQGLNAVSNLNLKMASSVAQLTQGFHDKDITAVKEAWDVYSVAAKDRQDRIQKMIDDANKAIQQQFDNQLKIQEFQLEQQKFEEQKKTDAASIANIYDQIADRRYQRSLPNQGKPFTDAQQQAAGYGARVELANKTLQQLQDAGQFSGMNWAQFKMLQSNSFLANALLSPEQQQIAQAERNFINAVLRRESGAAISQSEFDNARTQYFPQYGDSQAVLDQKNANRSLVFDSLQRAAGGAYVPVSDAELKMAGLAPTSETAVKQLASFQDSSPANADLLSQLYNIFPTAEPQEIVDYLSSKGYALK